MNRQFLAVAPHSFCAANCAPGDDSRRHRRGGGLYSRPSAIPLAPWRHAQNLTEKVQELPQHPVGFADIVEKVKPA